jgi:hypothetical protein
VRLPPADDFENRILARLDKGLQSGKVFGVDGGIDPNIFALKETAILAF